MYPALLSEPSMAHPSARPFRFLRVPPTSLPAFICCSTPIIRS